MVMVILHLLVVMNPINVSLLMFVLAMLMMVELVKTEVLAILLLRVLLIHKAITLLVSMCNGVDEGGVRRYGKRKPSPGVTTAPLLPQLTPSTCSNLSLHLLHLSSSFVKENSMYVFCLLLCALLQPFFLLLLLWASFPRALCNCG